MTQEARLPETLQTQHDEELERQSVIDQANLDYFLGETFEVEDPGNLDDYAKGYVIDSILLLNSTRAQPTPGSTTDRDTTLRRMNEVERARKKHGQTGIGLPKSEAELRAITNTGPEERFARAARTARGNRNRAAESTFAMMESCRADALEEVIIYNQVMIARPDNQLVADINLLRSNRQALRLIGDHLMYREFLDKMRWPATSTNEYKERQKYWRGCMMAAAEYASPSMLGAIMPGIVKEARSGLSYWTEKTHKIATETPAGIAVQSRMTTVPGWLERAGVLDEGLVAARAEWVLPVSTVIRPPELTLSPKQAGVVEQRDKAGDTSAYLAQRRAGAPARGGVGGIVNRQKAQGYEKKLAEGIEESDRVRQEREEAGKKKRHQELIDLLRSNDTVK